MPTCTDTTIDCRRKAKSSKRDWRCGCFKLLGRRVGDRLEIRAVRGHTYMASLPVTAICRCCGRSSTLLPITHD